MKPTATNSHTVASFNAGTRNVTQHIKSIQYGQYLYHNPRYLRKKKMCRCFWAVKNRHAPARDPGEGRLLIYSALDKLPLNTTAEAAGELEFLFTGDLFAQDGSIGISLTSVVKLLYVVACLRHVRVEVALRRRPVILHAPEDRFLDRAGKVAVRAGEFQTDAVVAVLIFI